MRNALLLSAAMLLALPAAVQAQDTAGVGPDVGDWEVTAAGTGASDQEFDNNTLGVTASVGQYLMPNVLVGVRQTVTYSGSDDDNVFTGATRVFADYVFDLGRWRPYVGVGLGGVYGEGVNDSFTAGPEVGVKYYADDNTFVYAQTEYQFAFQDADEIDDSFDDGGFFHVIGVGFNF